jgi:hypothetical protein
MPACCCTWSVANGDCRKLTEFVANFLT